MKVGVFLTKEDIECCKEELYKFGSPSNIYAQENFAKAIEHKILQHIHKVGFHWVNYATQLNLLEN